MSFYHPDFFWLLLIPFALALAEWHVRRRRGPVDTLPKIIRAEAHNSTLSLRPAAVPKNARIRWRLLLGLALAITALARPQWGRIEEPVFQQAREILVALDLSRSMASTDVKPTRIDRAKLLVTSLLEQLKGERVGLVDFAGTAFLQCPLSSDYEILNEFLPQLTPGYMPEEGTNYDALLHTTLDAFGTTNGADRFLIVLSDGGADLNDWRKYIPDLKARGIHVIALGIGTADGSMIPDGSGGFMKDDRGAVVLSKLDSSTLRELAEKTDGIYTDASSWVDLAKLIQATVDQGKRGDFKDVSRVRLAERFQWALAPALFLLAWSFWREFPVRPKPRALRLTGTIPTALLLMAFLILSFHPLIAETPPPDSSAAPLTKLVGRLAASPSLNASDYATFARTTLDYGTQLTSTQQPVPPGPVNDALAAVAAGRSLDPKAADWTALHAKLSAFLKQKKPPEQKKDQNKPDQKPPQKDQSKSSDQNKGDGKSDPKKQDPSKNPPSKSSPQQNQSGQKNDSAQPSPQDSSPQNQDSNGQPKSQPKPSSGQNQSAFGDMKKDTPPPQPSPQPQPTGNQTSPAPSPSTGMQQVGGTTQNQNPSATPDPALMVPLQHLEQVRQSDSPARLFQLMQAQDPNAKPPAHTGQNW